MTKSRLLAGALLIGWAAWWALFAFAQRPPLPIAAGVTLILFVIPLLAWRWNGPGGAVLGAEGLALLSWVAGLHNPPATTLFLVLTLGLPPLLSGILLMADGWKPKTQGYPDERGAR
jgi:hypothetical protein